MDKCSRERQPDASDLISLTSKPESELASTWLAMNRGFTVASLGKISARDVIFKLLIIVAASFTIESTCTLGVIEKNFSYF